jgi:hypothetical protein
MRGDVPPLPQYALMVWCSVKAQGQLYLYLLGRQGTVYLYSTNLEIITFIVSNVSVGISLLLGL